MAGTRREGLQAPQLLIMARSNAPEALKSGRVRKPSRSSSEVSRKMRLPRRSSSATRARISGIKSRSFSQIALKRPCIGGVSEMPAGGFGSWPVAQRICRSAASQKCIQSGMSIRTMSVARASLAGIESGRPGRRGATALAPCPGSALNGTSRPGPIASPEARGSSRGRGTAVRALPPTACELGLTSAAISDDDDSFHCGERGSGTGSAGAISIHGSPPRARGVPSHPADRGHKLAGRHLSSRSAISA